MALVKSGCRPSSLNPLTSFKIVKTSSYPRALYGCEIWNNLTRSEITLLETANHFVIKTVQNLPKLTRSDKALSLLGAFTIESVIDTKKLLFLGNLCMSESNMLPKQVFLSRLFAYKNGCVATATGFIPDIVNVLRRYSLSQYLETFTNCLQFPSKHSWKTVVKRAVRKTEVDSWKQRLLDDPDFAAFRLVHKTYDAHPAWAIS